MSKSKRLTPKMRETLRKIQSGYELGSANGKAWLLKGAESESVSMATFRGLVERGAIERRIHSFSGVSYVLTAQWRNRDL